MSCVVPNRMDTGAGNSSVAVSEAGGAAPPECLKVG